jgi:hypothetical protein
VPDELDLVRSFRNDIPGPSTDAWARAKAAVAEASITPERNLFGVGEGRRHHRDTGRGGKFRTVIVACGVAVLALVATAIAATQSGSPLLTKPVQTRNAGGPSTPNASGSDTVRLASYSFPLPEGFHLTSTSTTLPACFPLAVIFPGPGAPPSAAPANPYSNSQIASAASADGGCIFMVMTVPYALGSGGSDPYELPDAQPITVGSYAGWTEVAGSSHGSPTTQLAVRIPATNGQYRDLVVAAIGLSTSEVSSFVEQGLPSS